MKRWIHSAAAILTAFLALLLFAGAVRSGASTGRRGQDPAQATEKIELARPVTTDRAGSSRIQAAAEYSRTRIVTITVGATPMPGSPGLNSRWQVDLFDQTIIPPGKIQLPTDAYDITFTLVSGEASIDYAHSAILITNSQGLYYEYRTNQQAQRFGNQTLISQTYSHNFPLHYVATLNFTDPYRYLGYAGYAPTPMNTTQLQWDESFTGPLPATKRYQFDAATSLFDPAALPRPDLQIMDSPPPTLSRRLNHIYVSANIHNNGPMTSGAPIYVNLYDRVPPFSALPTGPLDLDGGWCSETPIAQCGGASNPLPPVPPFQTMIFSAAYDLKPITGQHDIYLFVDALGIVDALGTDRDLGLNYESDENNNSIKVGSLMWQDLIFLPLIRRS